MYTSSPNPDLTTLILPPFVLALACAVVIIALSYVVWSKRRE